MWGSGSQDTVQTEGQDVPDDPHDDIELESGPEKLTEPVLQYKEQETPLVAENVRVLCWIMTGPTTHQSKVK